MRNILVINAGSSSLKYQLINMVDESVIAKGLVERIGMEGSIHTYKPEGKDSVKTEKTLKDHTEAISCVLSSLVDPKIGVIKSMDDIAAVGHRFVHGGEKFSGAVVIDDEVIKTLDELSSIAPLHNPPNLMGIRACQANMPGKAMVGLFDTAFHSTMPAKAFIYAIPYEAYTDMKIRRYGFHGTSHAYVSKRAIELLGNPAHSKIITCHLGNGSSICAVVDGKSFDTSMGFTPLEGVPMGTRSGDIDPAIQNFLMGKGYTKEDVDKYLNKKSGVLGISGVSSDFRDISDAANAGNKRAQLALDVFAYRVKKYIGAYAAAMNGVDAIVFTAGIGENDKNTRAMILEGLDYLGLDVDFDYNDKAPRGKEIQISKPSSKVKAFVIPTNEELVIAREADKLSK
jgi:acetate kinase